MSSSRVLQVCKFKRFPKPLTRSTTTLSATAPLSLEPAEQDFRDKYYPRIGNRDIVGFGRNGSYSYIDNLLYPYPALRWEQNSAESKALMEKAQGDWKMLSMDDKKKLYRHSFCQTFAELKAPNSEWKIVWALVLLTLTASCWVYVFMRNFVLDGMMPSTFTREHHQAQLERMAMQRQGIVDGISATYDYEKGQFRK